ncbi:hypothetical protein TraAM80_04869 [Trypanosoma rangeli]|uniref:Uncharacterized protein n=1 Tax=Trypanosoma rangeli TaxID=5698 RepID=A0A3R7KMK5_TRYRA|nr:uncharacterized protein TraAM80_04869 [Trypanosoma rangeli]RNF04673.1 hypothetical protein TraAM80_04869 [Trypanosoma rangeli]|eukprot:RNF04673.1 hypothetical protein TraAM80_04869 [Trypanosoma rangeli]
MIHGNRGSSVPVVVCEGDDDKRPCGNAGAWMHHFLCPADPTNRASGAEALDPKRWRGSRSINGSVSALHPPSRSGGLRRSLASRGCTVPSDRGVATIYDPLSCTPGGRVEYHAEVGQAVVNTARLLERADRPRRRIQASAYRGTAPLNGRSQSYNPSHRASQHVVDVSSRSLAEALSGSPGVRSETLPFPITEPGLMPLEGDALLHPPPAVPFSGRGVDAGRSRSTSSALVLARPDSIKDLRKRALLLRNGRIVARQGEEPVAWRPEHNASDAHRDVAVSDGAASCGVASPTTRWRDAGGTSVSSGPTLHYKQLTEAFYGNYSGGVLAREAYLHFVAEMNHQPSRGSHGAPRRPQRVREIVENRRQVSGVADAPLVRGVGSAWLTKATSQSK